MNKLVCGAKSGTKYCVYTTKKERKKNQKREPNGKKKIGCEDRVILRKNYVKVVNRS